MEGWHDPASVHTVAQQGVPEKAVSAFSVELFHPNHLLPIHKVGRVDILPAVVFEDTGVERPKVMCSRLLGW